MVLGHSVQEGPGARHDRGRLKNGRPENTYTLVSPMYAYAYVLRIDHLSLRHARGEGGGEVIGSKPSVLSFLAIQARSCVKCTKGVLLLVLRFRRFQILVLFVKCILCCNERQNIL